MYNFMVDKYDKMLDGRSIQWLADNIGYSRVFVSDILNGKRSCRKAIGIAIVKTLNKDYVLEDFFEQVDKVNKGD